VPATAVDAKDADTPDNWVPRDPRIVRLTGRHPLNCEPAMQDLMAAGFITPPSIHYVRNHGAVPKLDWATHRCARCAAPCLKSQGQAGSAPPPPPPRR
jgi:nitrate reductase (NAD(P)H)